MKSICRCCNGRRVVLTVNGEVRPCSRCSIEQFEAWLRDRAPRSQGNKDE